MGGDNINGTSPTLDPSLDEDTDAQSPEAGLTFDQNADNAGSPTASPPDTSPADGTPNKPSVPMQKRRRVTRACDECRRKKIKCDGKQPCTHCTVYSYGKDLLRCLE